VAALWVVGFHLVPLLGHIFEVNLDLIPVVREGYLGVDIFFILSGFILCHVYVSSFQQYGIREHVHFLMVRLARIYPLHVVVMLAFAIALWFVPGIASQNGYPRYTAPGFFIAILLLQNWYRYQLIWNGPAWSLSAEWLAYLVFPFLLIATRWIKAARFAIALAALSLGILALTFVASGHSIDATGKAGFARLAGEFTAGALINRAHNLGLPGRISWRWANPIAATLLVATLLYRPAVPFSVLLFGFLVFSLSMHEGRLSRILSSRPMVFLGEISYSVYLVQSLLLELTTWYIKRYGMTSSGTSLGVAALLIILLLFVPILTWRTVERPARVIGRRLSNRLDTSLAHMKRIRWASSPADGE